MAVKGTPRWVIESRNSTEYKRWTSHNYISWVIYCMWMMVITFFILSLKLIDVQCNPLPTSPSLPPPLRVQLHLDSSWNHSTPHENCLASASDQKPDVVFSDHMLLLEVELKLFPLRITKRKHHSLTERTNAKKVQHNINFAHIWSCCALSEIWEHSSDSI